MAGEAELGGGVGTAIGSIWGPVGGAIGGAIGKGIGGVAAAPGGGGGPIKQDAANATYGTELGNSGWVINFGGTQNATAPTYQNQTYPGDGQPDYLGIRPQQAAVPAFDVGMGGSSMQWALLLIAAVVAIKVLRK